MGLGYNTVKMMASILILYALLYFVGYDTKGDFKLSLTYSMVTWLGGIAVAWIVIILLGRDAQVET